MKFKEGFIAVALAALVLGGLGFASPLSLQIDDSSFDYANTDLEVGYISLGYEDGELELTLSSSDLATAIPPIALSVPAMDGADMFGDDLLADREDLGEVEWVRYGRNYRGVQVVHSDASLLTTHQGYAAALEALGFDAEVESRTASTWVYRFEQDDQVLRVVFTRQGYDIRVSMLGV